MSRLKEIKKEIKALKLERELIKSQRKHPLIVEAIKKGYKKGNFKSLNGNGHEFTTDPVYWYHDEIQDKLYTRPKYKGGACLYEKGVWATIIKNK